MSKPQCRRAIDLRNGANYYTHNSGVLRLLPQGHSACQTARLAEGFGEDIGRANAVNGDIA